ncbi:SDR family oxidoreductase [uncultured Tistrella sp.]|uniref:SDR family oxidoreductase n=1 Tax=Tistrella mobilis TaxID=171437 RepID=UPI000C0AD46A|nr:SDR family oxidoreductase [uncultured Tistrella sp.]MAM75394.1 short chain dehydrogenase [Tistrella sp.]|tara:strand:+ start:927 stop:1841 length:915 start_codon:yes stop_codon:yes gene_type:complete
MTMRSMNDIPFQSGRRAVITGTGGLGYEAARALCRAGAQVILAGRNAAKGADAVGRIRAAMPGVRITFEHLDLASLDSVGDFAARLGAAWGTLDLLINNAGVMVPPRRQQTADGFELQWGVNYLGHFALTAHLLPLLRTGRNPRVISLSSIAARNGTIDFDDLNAARSYRPMPAYSQSKLACLMFALELQRRSEAAGWGITSMAAHPGVSRTDLLHNGPGRRSPSGMARTYLWFLFQPAERGALPMLYAATAPEATGGGYYGPRRMSELRGFPAPARIPPQAEDRGTAARLWEVSQVLARVRFA